MVTSDQHHCNHCNQLGKSYPMVLISLYVRWLCCVSGGNALDLDLVIVALQINNIGVESISLQDARRQLEKSKEKLQLTLKKPPRAPSVTNLLHKRQNR